MNGTYYLESDHPTQSDSDKLYYLYTNLKTAAFTVTFSADTKVEPNYDWLILYNTKGGLVGKYTGTELAGRTITLPGDGIYVRVVTDYSVNYYGFAIQSVRLLENANISSITTVAGPKASVKWDAPYSASGFELQRAVVNPATGLSGTYYTIATGGGTAYTDANVAPGMLYSYRVRFYKTLTYNGKGYRYYSNFGYKRQYIARTPVISGGFGSKWYQGIVVNWNAVKGANGYIVYRADSLNGTYERIGETTAPTYTDMVPERRSYYYKVRAKATVCGLNYVSAASNAKLVGYVGTPTGVRASGVNSTTVKLQWNTVAGATGYAIYRSTSPDSGFAWFTQTTALTLTTRVPTAGQVYYYQVRAFNDKQQYSGFSETAAILPMNAPTNLHRVTHTKTSVTVAWNPVPGATYYKVFRSYNGTKWPVSATVTGTSYTFSGLEESYQYSYFIVKAYRDINVNGTTTTCMSVGSNTLRVEKNMVNFRYLGIVEEDFPGTADDLFANGADAKSLRAILAKASPYGRPIASGGVYMNQSKASILSRISSSLAAKADSNDVSLFYISCHGNSSVSTGTYAGELYLSDGSWMTMSELANALKAVPGRVVVILDSCGSGAAIGKNAPAASKSFASKAITAFANVDEQIVVEEIREAEGDRPMDSEFVVANKFYVVAAAKAGTLGWSNNVNGSYLMQWINAGVMGADSDGDGKVVLRELQSYLTRRGNGTSFNYYGQIVHMLPQVYPTNSSFPIFQRR